MPAHRLRAVVAFALVAGVLVWHSPAHSAAEVSKLSLVLSGSPTSLSAKDFNETVIGGLNRRVLQPRGLEGLDNISYTWLYDAQLRYFVRQNFAAEFGVGHMRTVSKREYLPTIQSAVQIRTELLSVPVHVGGAYYLPSYNQGDFMARAYLGGGLLSLVFNREKFETFESNTDSASTLIGSFKVTGRGDSPGYYLETGVHMFFASRFSVMIGALYRSAKVRNMESVRVNYSSAGAQHPELGPTVPLDLSGIGARFAVAIGL